MIRPFKTRLPPPQQRHGLRVGPTSFSAAHGPGPRVTRRNHRLVLDVSRIKIWTRGRALRPNDTHSVLPAGTLPVSTPGAAEQVVSVRCGGRRPVPEPTLGGGARLTRDRRTRRSYRTSVIGFIVPLPPDNKKLRVRSFRRRPGARPVILPRQPPSCSSYPVHSIEQNETGERSKRVS
jgi:hypothetical protein